MGGSPADHLIDARYGGFAILTIAWFAVIGTLTFLWLEPLGQRLIAYALSNMSDRGARMESRTLLLRAPRIMIPFITIMLVYMTYPRFLAGHKAWCGVDSPVQYKLANAVTFTLDGRRIPWVYSSGTLLGLLRNGRFLPWEHDVDISICASDWPAAHQSLVEAGLDVVSFVPTTSIVKYPLPGSEGMMDVVGRVYPTPTTFWLRTSEVWVDIEVRADGSCAYPPRRLIEAVNGGVAPGARTLPSGAALHPLAHALADERALLLDSDKDAVDRWAAAQATVAVTNASVVVADCVSYTTARLRTVVGANRALLLRGRATGRGDWGGPVVGGTDYTARVSAAAAMSQVAAAEYAVDVVEDLPLRRICVPAGGSPLARLQTVWRSATVEHFVSARIDKGFGRTDLQCALWYDDPDITQLLSQRWG